MGFQKSAACAEQQVSRCPFVLVDQSTQDRVTLDLGPPRGGSVVEGEVRGRGAGVDRCSAVRIP